MTASSRPFFEKFRFYFLNQEIEILESDLIAMYSHAAVTPLTFLEPWNDSFDFS